MIKKIARHLAVKVLKNDKISKRLSFFALSTTNALQRTLNRGIEINTVIDIGASDGQWSKKVATILKDANYLMVEAQKNHKANLEDLCRKSKNFDFIISAAGDEDGETAFDDTELYGGAVLANSNINSTMVNMVKVDSLIKEKNLNGPFLLKLDTHGFEKPILEGAANALKSTNLLIIEVYNFRLNATSLKFFELCAYLESKGFSPIDISEPMWRKKDSSFWQMDMLFVRSDRKEFNSNSYD